MRREEKKKKERIGNEWKKRKEKKERKERKEFNLKKLI